MDIFIYIVIFWSGGLFGVALCWWLLPRLKSYGGLIVANANEIEDKVIYSLVLFGDPNDLQYEREILFKIVDPSEEEALSRPKLPL